MSQIQLTKKHHYFLFFLIVIVPFLFGIAYLIGFNNNVFAMAVLDRTSNSPINSSSASPTWQHTTGNFSNRILVVAVSYVGISSPSVSYNGIALTRATNYVYVPANTLSFFYLVNPPIGTFAITANGGIGVAIAGANTYYNVDQTNPISLPTNRTGLGLGPIVSVTATVTGTNTNQIIIDGFLVDSKSATIWPPLPVVGSGQTRQWLTYYIDTTDGDRVFFSGSSKQGSAGSTSMSWTASGVTDNIWAYSAIALNPPAAAPPTVTPIPTVTPVPTPIPIVGPGGGNIANLNFGITDSLPWLQSVCGDIRVDSGFSTSLPVGQSAIRTNPSCTEPGIIFTGDSSASFGKGQASSSNWVVGGTTYPEVYTPPNTGGIFSSYAYLYAKAQTTDTPPVNLSTICPLLTNCTLPANLPRGVYHANSSVALNGYTFLPNQHYVFLINGDLTIRGNILTPVTSSSFFSTAGNIIIPSTVGNPAALATANLSGIFSADRSFIMDSNNNCTDLRLNLEGTLIVNAGRTGGLLQNNRDLCGDNPTTPALQLTQRLDFVLNLPDFIRLQRTTLEEVAP